ncbi:MAG: hypothetical protein LBS63_04345 [Prevotellaceae bacterium]|jgi:hypothetical protein|nr:hypothetical protein [Prevotellaceae bacterium]
MEYSTIFLPVAEHLQKSNAAKSAEQWGNRLKYGVKGFDWEWLSDFQLALVGLRKPGQPNSFVALREELYALYAHEKPLQAIDLGDIEVGVAGDAGASDAAAYALQKLLSLNVLPVVFCENMLCASLAYKALKAHQEGVAATLILPSVSLGSAQEPPSDDNFMAHIMADYGRGLEALSVVGYQSYLSSPADVQALAKQHCECIRLGHLRDHLLCAEPTLRDADLLCASVNAVRQSDAPAATAPSPNGLYAEEMCHLLRFASFSDMLKSCYVGGFNLTGDSSLQTTKLVAQLIWHVADGVAHRVGDHPLVDKACRRLQVEMGGRGQQLTFYHSKASDRWWMLVPEGKERPPRVVACLKEDYERTLHMEIPDRWLLFQKKWANR